ncbi:MAG: metallophosphoesterase, partial [Methanomicrobium sp.]|nr:metallophosphoesterase [Methanomicrobium sp.]
LSTLLLKTLYRRCKKPLHTPRKFCFLTDVLSIDISINDKKYRTYSIPKKEWHQPGDKNAHKKTLEEYRILCRYQLCSRNGFSADGKTKKIFVSSDLHLGHCDIIDAAARPFKKDSVKEMDEILISNWNCTVDADDTVIFAGDLTYNKNSDETDEYLKRLNGDIIFISGNHDTAKCKMHTQYELKHGGFSFLFIHNPKNAPEKYDGWIVHGHTHNSRMCEYPFIDFQNRTINISCELTQYRPADIDEIIDIIKCGMNRRINRIYSMDAGAF